MTLLKYLLFAFLFSAILFSCKKESFITSADANVSTSIDTLLYDTVFTSAGSITQSFKIFNNNNQKLRLSQVKLSGGSASPFKINVNGTAANEVDNIEVNANDSIYVFVQVNVNPTNADLPFLIRDSILISFNGNKRFVQLQAYGQNAVFLNNVHISGNVTWNKTLPYVILGGIDVDSAAMLTIPEGTKIYLHANAPFLVDGTLIANGTKQDSITFSGDRLDLDYKDLPASWPGIFFRSSSHNNFLKHTIIKNAYQGIIAQDLSADATPKVTLSQCIINNIYDAGVLGIHTNIYADNSLISNCGSNVLLELGGSYRFINCTVASYSNFNLLHKNPVLQISNAAMQGGVTFTSSLKAYFQNCIFWGDGGNVDNEVAVDKEGNDTFAVTFDHVLYKALQIPASIDTIAVIQNVDPMFDSVDVIKNYYDFHFNTMPFSPAIDAGSLTTFPFDLDDKPRTIGLATDLGCYEK